MYVDKVIFICYSFVYLKSNVTLNISLSDNTHYCLTEVIVDYFYFDYYWIFKICVVNLEYKLGDGI